MSWKEHKQQNIAEALASHHKTLEELDDIHALLDFSIIEYHLINDL